MKWKVISLKIIKWFLASIFLLVLSISTLLYFFKDTIISYALKEINKHLAAEVRVGKIDLTFWTTFPNLSLDLNEVFIPDAFPTKKSADTLLYTDQLRLKFNPIDIWNEKYRVKKIVIKPGVVKLRIAANGENNYQIFKPSNEDQSSSFKLSLESIEAKNLRFLYANNSNKSYYQAAIHEMKLKGDFTSKEFDLSSSLSFNIKKIQHGLVPFIVNQEAQTAVTVTVNQDKGSIQIPNGTISISEIPFSFQLNVLPKSLKLKVNAPKIPIEELANKIALKEVQTVKQLKGSGFASFLLNVESDLNKDALPLIDCKFNVSNGKLTEPTQGVTLSHINIAGSYSTLAGKNNEILALKTFAFQTASGPFSGNLTVTNFEKPTYKGATKGNIDLSVIQAIFQLPKIEKLAGNIGVDTRFHLQTHFENEHPVLEIVDGEGNATLKQVMLQLQQDTRQFHSINGNLMLNKNEAVLEDLEVKLGESNMLLNGNFNAIDLFLQDKHPLEIDVIAESSNINLKDFSNNFISEAATENNTENPRDWILPTKITGLVKLQVGKIILNQHTFSQVGGEMQVGERSILFQKIHGISANATVTGTLGVYESSPEYFELATNLSSKDIYFKPIFREWNNFEQQVILENNISGRAEAILDLKAPFDLRYGILKENIEAQIQLKVFSGQLSKVETFTSLAKDLKQTKAKLILNKDDIAFLDKKLQNIQFETLENTIFIKNGTVIIPKMDIHSSALNISLEAKHQFNNVIDYKFAFRFRDLKAQKDESEFGIVEDDGTGVQIFVRMSGNLVSPKIEWDKTSRKEVTQQNRVEAKKEAMSILKSELGLFKKDTTVKKYQPQRKEHEVLQIEFGKEEKVNPYEEKQKIESEKKGLKNMFNKLKEKNKEESEEFTVD